MYYLKKKKSSTGKKTGKSRLSTLTRKLDEIFSLYIRARDSKDGHFRCISCGRILPYEQADCGHYFSRTHKNTRWDEENANSECRKCNRYCSDHLEGYRIHLIEKIGQRNFDLLSVRAHQIRKWSEFELEELIKYYKAKYESLKEIH